MQSYFIWNGVDCRTKGIILRNAAPLVRPEERVAHLIIPGMCGDLTEVEGDNIYNAYIQTVGISVKSADNARSAFRWLRGSGYVTFSGDPYKKQEARVINAVTLDKASRNIDHWAGEVQFYCQPLKQALSETAITLTAAESVNNNGDVASYPIILAYPTGQQAYMDITVNGKTLRLTDIRNVRRIDCKAQEVTNAAQTVLVTKNSAGPFPVLQVGSNTIGGSGWTKLEIYKEERYL